MDEMIVRPKYSRQTGTQRKRRSANENELMSTVFAVKMLAVVVFLSVFALCKAADTETTNYFVAKVNTIVSKNFDTNKYLLNVTAALGIKLPEKNMTKQLNASGKNEGSDLNSDQSVQTLSQSGSDIQNSPLQKDTGNSNQVKSTADPSSEVNTDMGQSTSSGTLPENPSSSISENLQALIQVPVLEEEEIKALANKYSFVIPIKGQIDSTFGIRTDPLSGKTSFHSGIDIKANMGTSIKAALDGEVSEVGSSPEYDKYVKIKHSDGLYTVYAHCSILVAKKGQKVKQGDVIAKVGDSEGLSGAYLHFEVWKDGKAADPEKILNLLNNT